MSQYCWRKTFWTSLVKVLYIPLYPMIRTVFFSKISPGVQTPSTIPLYYSMLLNSWMKPEKLHILPEFVVFFYFHVFFSGTILKFEHLKDFLWFRWSSRSTFTFPGLLPGIKVHWNFGGVLGGKTPWLINFFFFFINTPYRSAVFFSWYDISEGRILNYIIESLKIYIYMFISI